MVLDRILNHKSKTITSAAIVLIIATFLAKLTALFRDRIIASIFGASREVDIYYSAFRIPDLIFNILVVGAISSVLIPVFAEYWEKNSKKEAWVFFNNVLFIFSFLIFIVGVIFVIFAPLFMKLVVPGFSGKDFQLVVLLTRIMFISPLLLTISSIFGSLLQYFSKFLIYSFAPIVYNIGIIIGAVFFVPRFGTLGLAFGVVLGALLHLLIQLPSVFSSGFKFHFVFNLKESGFLKIIKLAIPRTIAIAAGQIDLIITTAVASLLMAGSIAVFNFANNLQYVPISLFGISFSIAAFPALSRSFSLGKKEDFVNKLTLTFSQIIFFIVPICFLTFILRAQIVRVVFGAGQFSWNDTRLTAACLGLYSIAIFGQSLVPLFSQAFFAMQDTKTPVKINVFSIFLDTLFTVVFVFALAKFSSLSQFFVHLLKLEGVKGLPVIGIPLAFSFSSSINIVLLIYALKKKTRDHWEGKMQNIFKRIFLLALGCAILCYLLLYLFAPIFGLETFWGVFFQMFFAGGISIFFYFLFAKKLNFPEYNLITGTLFKKVVEKTNLIEVESEP